MQSSDLLSLLIGHLRSFGAVPYHEYLQFKETFRRLTGGDDLDHFCEYARPLEEAEPGLRDLSLTSEEQEASDRRITAQVSMTYLPMLSIHRIFETHRDYILGEDLQGKFRGPRSPFLEIWRGRYRKDPTLHLNLNSWPVGFDTYVSGESLELSWISQRDQAIGYEGVLKRLGEVFHAYPEIEVLFAPEHNDFSKPYIASSNLLET